MRLLLRDLACIAMMKVNVLDGLRILKMKQQFDETQYGEKFEVPVIIAMVVLIVLSFVGVIALHQATSKDCTASTYTYCG
jgi:hypothetical protein